MLNSLNVAQSGLAVAQVQVENVMNNVANENTVGYKKRVVSTSELNHNDERIAGRGVSVNSIDRITDIYVYDKLIKEQSKNAQHTELSDLLASIEAIFHETKDSGLSSDLNRYLQSIEDLRANPKNEIYKNNVINYGNILVDDLKTVYKNIEERELIIQNELDDDMGTINQLLEDIGTTNKQIIDSQGASNALFDKRDLLETKIAQYVDINISRVDDYVLNIGGVSAVRYDTNIHNLAIKNNYLPQKDIYVDKNNDSTLINKTTWDGTDSVTYYFNKEINFTITAGDEFINANGDKKTVDKDNIVQAMVVKINNDPRLINSIEAHNGQYSIDSKGNKVEIKPQTTDYFLLVESKIDGIDGKFDSRIIVNDNDNKNASGDQVSNLSEISILRSVKATNDIHIEIFDSKLNIKSGKIKSMLDNIDTTSQNNKFSKYKQRLDDFAKALSDFTEAYIWHGDDKYTSGEQNSLLHKDKKNIKRIGLFEGTSVKNLNFNDAVVNDLNQENLNYLATMQWNQNINIDSTSENTTSFMKFYEATKVVVSAEKENINYLKETQEAVTKSLQLNYDKLVKVNKDDEMINLIKFQSAYEANAKLITIVDELLSTILNMKR
jgi:flagellar hook-associated protein 1 FlgK